MKLETKVGAFFIASIVVIGILILRVEKLDFSSSKGDQELFTYFGQVAGLAQQSAIRVAGVKVGAVTAVNVDPKTLRAEVKMNVRKDILIPADSTAQIQSDSLLGGSYIFVLIGGDPDLNLPTDGTGVFDYTRGTVDIMSLLLEAVGNASGGGDQGGGMAEEAPL